MLIKAALIMGLAYAGIMALVYAMQDSMVYFPGRTLEASPRDIGLAFEEVSITTEDGLSLSAWHIPATPERAILLFCHGNAGNISHRLDSIRIFHNLGLSVFIFDYRGYGRSEGRPTEDGTYRDAAAAWRYLVAERGAGPERIVVFGRSLGAAVAAETALQNGPGALILESAFTSLPDLGRTLYPWLPVRLLSRYRYDTLSKIRNIRCPKLIIHARGDELVPFSHGETVYREAAPPKEFLEVQGGHNDGFLSSGEAYVNGLRAFLDRAFPEQWRSSRFDSRNGDLLP